MSESRCAQGKSRLALRAKVTLPPPSYANLFLPELYPDVA